MTYPIPADEKRRLQALERLGFDAGEPEAELDVLVNVAARALGASIGLVTLLGKQEQRFAARRPLSLPLAIPRDQAFCNYTIMQHEPFLVPDAMSDPRFASNPLVTGAMSVRAYAGVPLEVEPGQRVGALCVLDDKPRPFSPEQVAELSALGSVARRLLVAHREKMQLATALAERDAALDRLIYKATHCELTGLLRAVEFRRRAEAVLKAGEGAFVLTVLDLDRFKQINDKYGHALGDRVLAAAGSAVAEGFAGRALAGRMGGDEFAVLAPEQPGAPPESSAEVARAALCARLQSLGHGAFARVSMGVARAAADTSFAVLFQRADTALYAAKAGGRNRTCVWQPGMASFVCAPDAAGA